MRGGRNDRAPAASPDESAVHRGEPPRTAPWHSPPALDETRSGAMATATGFDRCDIFLCHNRHDQAVVKQIAEGLELEFGIPHFLDDYAIPAGEAFLPWIERALAESRGCAIFLGPNGWGPTHLVEAEKALLRYQADPTFRLIPVVLGEVGQEDASCLGNGTVFRDINWVRIAGATPDREAIDKLRAALTDSPIDTTRGPARLTPYLLRREALRWRETGHDDLLPRGMALAEARQVRAAAPDLTAGAEVAAFLDAAAGRVISRLRRLVAIAAASSVALALLAGLAWYQRTIAHSRELAALALASERRDEAMLLAVAAWDVWPTVESRASMLRLLTTTRHAQRILHGHAAGVRAVDIDAEGRIVAAGGEGAALHVWDLERPEAPPRLFPPPPSTGTGDNRIHDLAWIPGRAEIVIAYERGGVRIWSAADGHSRPIAGWPPATASTARAHTDYYGPDPEPPETRSERAVTAVAMQPGSTLVAAVDASGRVFLIDPAVGRLRWRRSTDLYGVESVHWTPDGRLIVVGDEAGNLRAITTGGEPVRIAGARPHRGRILLLAADKGLEEGFLTLDTGGVVHRWRATDAGIERVSESVLSISAVSAGLAPGGDHALLATRAGVIRSFDLASGEEREADALVGHRLAAMSVRCQATGKYCISGGVGGQLVVWDLAQQHPLLARAVPFVGLVNAFWRRPVDGLGVLVQPAEGLEWSSVVGDRRVRRNMPVAAAYVPRPDSAEIAIAPTNEMITVLPSLTADDGTVYPVPEGSHGQLYRLAMSRTGRWLAAADNRPRVIVWRRGEPHAPVLAVALPAFLSSLAFTRDERSLVVGTLSGEVLRWSLDLLDPSPTSRQVANGPVFALAFSPAGDRLYVGSGAGDRNIRILDVPSLRTLDQLPERHEGSISEIAVSADGALLASSSDDGVVELWDGDSGRELGALPHALDTIFQAMIFDAQRGKLLVASDKAVFEWDVTDAAMIAAACRVANPASRSGGSSTTTAVTRGIALCGVSGARDPAGSGRGS